MTQGKGRGRHGRGRAGENVDELAREEGDSGWLDPEEVIRGQLSSGFTEICWRAGQGGRREGLV